MSGEKTMAYLLGFLVFGSISNSLWAASSENPYQGIVQRNVFDVRPPPAPIVEAPPAPPLPEIWLNGLTDILGRKQALLKVRFPSKPPKEESYIFGEGQREGDIEILAIDVRAGTVKVKNFDTIMNLSVEANSSKLANAPPDVNLVQPVPSFPVRKILKVPLPKD
jgi:hypothetical protein